MSDSKVLKKAEIIKKKVLDGLIGVLMLIIQESLSGVVEAGDLGRAYNLINKLIKVIDIELNNVDKGSDIESILNKQRSTLVRLRSLLGSSEKHIEMISNISNDMRSWVNISAFRNAA